MLSIPNRMPVVRHSKFFLINSMLLVIAGLTSCGSLQHLAQSHGSAPLVGRPPIHIVSSNVRPPLPYRMVSFHRGKADKRLIQLAHDLGFNGVQIQIEGSTVSGIKQFAKYDADEHVVDFCHRLGMRVTLWVHEMSDLPEPWLPEWLGSVTTDNAALWSVLDARYDWVLDQAVPQVDGLVLTVVETEVRATDSALLVKLVEMLRHKCDLRGKSLIVRTFVWYPEEFASVMAAIDRLPADQVVMSKCVPQDWNIRGVDAPEIGHVGGRPQIIEFDAAGEYFRKDEVANCMPDLLKRQFDHAVASGAKGICVRVDRDDMSVLNQPSEMNLWTLGMLASGATNNLDDIWSAWAVNRFGKAAGPGVIRALKPTGEVVSELLSVGPFTLGDTRSFPPLGDADVFGQPPSQSWYWDPSLADAHRKAEAGDADFTAEVRASKTRAGKLADVCLLNLDLVREQLAPFDYEILRTKLLTNKAQLTFRGLMSLAVLDYRRMAYASNYAMRYQANIALENDLSQLLALAGALTTSPPTQITWLGQSWSVGGPLGMKRDDLLHWAYQMHLLRRGQDAQSDPNRRPGSKRWVPITVR